MRNTSFLVTPLSLQLVHKEPKVHTEPKVLTLLFFTKTTGLAQGLDDYLITPPLNISFSNFPIFSLKAKGTLRGACLILAGITHVNPMAHFFLSPPHVLPHQPQTHHENLKPIPSLPHSPYQVLRYQSTFCWPSTHMIHTSPLTFTKNSTHKSLQRFFSFVCVCVMQTSLIIIVTKLVWKPI